MHECDPFPYGGAVPPGAILSGEQHEAALVTQPARPPGVGEENEGQKAGDIRVVGEKSAQDAGQVQGSLHQVAPDQIGPGGSGVPGRVQHVDDAEDGIDPRGSSATGGTRNGMRAMAIFFLARVMRAAIVDSLTKNAAADLRGGQPAEQTQGQRHLGFGADRRVTAREHEPQPVVDYLGAVDRSGPGTDRLDQQRKGPLVDRVATCQIYGAPPRHCGQPGSRFLRDAARAPGGQGTGIGVLDALLGQVDVPVTRTVAASTKAHSRRCASATAASTEASPGRLLPFSRMSVSAVPRPRRTASAPAWPTRGPRRGRRPQ